MTWLRGVLGTGLTWAAIWAAFGAAAWGIVRVVNPGSIDAGEGLLVAATTLAVAGFISGTGFAVALSLAERRHSLKDLSLPRVALWGALGSAIIPLLTQVDNSMIIITCPLGAAIAAATVAIARRDELASPSGPELLEH